MKRSNRAMRGRRSLMSGASRLILVLMVVLFGANTVSAQDKIVHDAESLYMTKNI